MKKTNYVMALALILSAFSSQAKAVTSPTTEEGCRLPFYFDSISHKEVVIVRTDEDGKLWVKPRIPVNPEGKNADIAQVDERQPEVARERSELIQRVSCYGDMTRNTRISLFLRNKEGQLKPRAGLILYLYEDGSSLIADLLDYRYKSISAEDMAQVGHKVTELEGIHPNQDVCKLGKKDHFFKGFDWFIGALVIQEVYSNRTAFLLNKVEPSQFSMKDDLSGMSEFSEFESCDTIRLPQ